MEALETSAMRKVTRRFMPLLFACLVAAFLDRVNVGFAALTMNRELGLSATVFGTGAGLFFLTYFILEVPSNLALERFGARRWIARIMITWGIVAGAMAFIQGSTSFYVLRLLLGAAEAGFAPGIMFFLTLWFPAAYRARALGYFLVAMPIASVIGAPISGFIVAADGAFGFKGWQLMFLIEAIPTLVLGGLVLLRLTDKPAQADWLSPQERTWLIVELGSEARRRDASGGRYGNVLTSPAAWGLGLVFFGMVGLNYGMSFFLPQIIHSFDISVRVTGMVGAIPFLFAAAFMVWWGNRSDAKGERVMHTLVPLVAALICLTLATSVTAPALKLVMITIACMGAFSAIVVFWALVSGMLPATQAAAGVAMINCLGSLSGFVGPFLIGRLKDLTGNYDSGLKMLAGFGAVAAVALVILTFSTRHKRENGPAFD